MPTVLSEQAALADSAAGTRTTAYYRSDIDGLRAIAVGLVLVFHFSLVPAITGGFLGVDVFFVISGFLISGIVLRQLDAGHFALGTFYVQRIRRLAPSLFVVLLMVTTAGAWLLFPAELMQLARQVFASQFYFANIYYWRTIGYFGLNAQGVYLLHTWSLGVEEQFYLIYPLALLLAHRYFRRYIWLSILVCCVLSFLLNLAIVRVKPELTFYLLPTRAWQLLLGAIAAGVAQKWRRGVHLNTLLAALGLVLIVGAATGFRAGIAIPGWFTLLPVLGSALVLLGGESPGGWVSRGLSWTPLAYVGRISYSLYLVHWPINVFAQRLLAAEYSINWRVALMALSVLLAVLLYHGVEQPARHRQVFKTHGTLLGGYAAALLCTVCGVWLVLGSGGLPQRFSPVVARLASYADDHSPPLEACQYSSAASLEHACQIGTPDAAPRWLVYGDSHAWAAHAAFDGWLKSRGEAGYFVFLQACPPLVGMHLTSDRDLCFRFNNDMMLFLEQHGDVQRVALVSAWREALEGLLSPTAAGPTNAGASLRVFADSFTRTLRMLSQLQRAVYVWEPLPGAKKDVPYALARAVDHAAPDIAYSAAEYRATFDFFFESVRQNHALIKGLFSPAAALCGTGTCAVVDKGEPLYFDQAHMTQSSAPFWRSVLQAAAPEH